MSATPAWALGTCPRCGGFTEWGWINVECCTRCGWNDRAAISKAVDRHARKVGRKSKRRG